MADERRLCDVCRGVGLTWIVQGAVPVMQPCLRCRGTGHLFKPKPIGDPKPRKRPHRNNGRADDA